MPGYNFDGDFEFFAKSFVEGNTEYGSYWTMLKVCTTTHCLKIIQKSGFSLECLETQKSSQHENPLV